MDGIFGAKTENAVKEFQRENGLTVDGVVGPKTWAVLGVDAGETEPPTEEPEPNEPEPPMEEPEQDEPEPPEDGDADEHPPDMVSVPRGVLEEWADVMEVIAKYIRQKLGG